MANMMHLSSIDFTFEIFELLINIRVVVLLNFGY